MLMLSIYSLFAMPPMYPRPIGPTSHIYCARVTFRCCQTRLCVPVNPYLVDVRCIQFRGRWNREVCFNCKKELPGRLPKTTWYCEAQRVRTSRSRLMAIYFFSGKLEKTSIRSSL